MYAIYHTIYHKVAYKLYVNAMLKVLICLVKWIFLCIFVVGKIITKEKNLPNIR